MFQMAKHWLSYRQLLLFICLDIIVMYLWMYTAIVISLSYNVWQYLLHIVVLKVIFCDHVNMVRTCEETWGLISSWYITQMFPCSSTVTAQHINETVPHLHIFIAFHWLLYCQKIQFIFIGEWILIIICRLSLKIQP